MIAPLLEVSVYHVYTDVEVAGEDAPLMEGTFRECEEFMKGNPNTFLSWFDIDMDRMPSTEIH